MTAIVTGEAMAGAKVKFDSGPEITSSITKEAADDLGLADGSKAVALIKSTEVALTTE